MSFDFFSSKTLRVNANSALALICLIYGQSNKCEIFSEGPPAATGDLSNDSRRSSLFFLSIIAAYEGGVCATNR